MAAVPLRKLLICSMVSVVVCMLIVIDHARYTIPGTGATFGSFFRWNHWGALLLFTVGED
jgi:hypothetical protein